MKLGKRFLVVGLFVMIGALAFVLTVNAGDPVTNAGAGVEGEEAVSARAAAVTPIPTEAPSTLPEFIGEPADAQAQPIPPARVPQNPFLAPNPFSYVHNDSWMSDTYDIAGPLGREPVVRTSTLADARSYPDSYLFGCAGSAFDSHGRLVLSCVEAAQTGPAIEDKATGLSLVLVDPVSLAVLAHMHLPPPKPGTKQLVSSSYLYHDNRDRSVVPIVDYDGKAKIKVIELVESAGTVSFQEVAAYDLSAYVPAGDNLNGLLPDWQGRIWFVVKNAGIVGVLDPETGSINTLALGGSITNTFAIDRDAVYVVTTQKMYRIGRGPDGAPQVVWEEGYRNIGSRKSGQLSAGTGTTPTVLGNGKYVAITDNDDQLHVVVYRTDAKLAPHEERIVCEVPVFKQGAGADENSLIGSGRSLIAFNCYGNELRPDMVDGEDHAE